MKENLNLELFKEEPKPLGNEKVSIKISSYSLEFLGLDENACQTIKNFYKFFVFKEGKIKVKSGIMPNSFRMKAKEVEDFALYEEDEWRMFFSPYFSCSKHNENNYFFFLPTSTRHIELSFENAVRFFLSDSIKNCGLIVHASAKVIDGKAHIFLANNLGGKSTAVELLEGYPTIADDILLIERINGEFLAHPWPIAHKFDQKKDEIKFYPINSFYKLVKSEENKIKALNSASSFAVMISSCPFKINMEEVIPICKEIASKFPFYELEFRKEKNFLFKVKLSDGK